MKITFDATKGMAPKYDDEQLVDGYAVTSVNTRPGREILEAWRKPTLVDSVNTAAPVRAIYKYLTKWFSWSTTVSAVRAPLTNDPYDYVIIAEEGQDPKVTYNLIAEGGAGPYPTATYPLNVPIPDAPIVSSITDADGWVEPTPAPQEDEYDNSATSYALVYRDAWGRLSALSDPSGTIEIREFGFEATKKVTLTLPTTPAGLLLTDAARGTSATVLVYRTNFAGNGLGVFQYVGTTAATDSTFVDQVFSGDLLEEPINEAWVGAPDTDTSLFPNGPMEKVIIAGANILAGHNKKILCFAEPDAFYAFPVDYYITFQQETIVTIAPAGANIVVLTNRFPYVVQGAHPSSMGDTRLSEPVPCSNKLGVTEVGGSVFYVSKTGLFSITDYTLENVSRPYMTEREWDALDPTTITLANYDGMVIIQCPAVSQTYLYSPFNPTDGLRLVDLDGSAFMQMEDTNDLAYVATGTSDIVQFDSHVTDFLPMEWVSKTYDLNVPRCFSFMKVKANDYPVEVTVEADRPQSEGFPAGGTHEHTVFVHGPDYVLLPFQSRSKRWRSRVSSAGGSTSPEIRSIEIGESPAEFN